MNVGEESVDVTPAVIARKDSNRYLVFYISPEDLDEDGEGELKLELVGIGTEPEGMIELDPDVDDPQIPNSVEFSVDNPGFTAEAAADIVVRS